MEALTKITSEKYAYIFFEVAQELYSVNPLQLVGNYKDVNALISFDVKSWKECNVIFSGDVPSVTIPTEAGVWYKVAGKRKPLLALKAYLGVK